MDLGLGEGLELGTSTDELTIEVDVGDGSLTIEIFEVGLNGIWRISAVWRERCRGVTYLRCRAGRACLLAGARVDGRHVNCVMMGIEHMRKGGWRKMEDQRSRYSENSLDILQISLLLQDSLGLLTVLPSQLRSILYHDKRTGHQVFPNIKTLFSLIA